jgi:GTPase
VNRFVDEVTIDLSSGHGGAGCVSFLREKYRPKGGPDGGNGGRGGDVIFIVKKNLKTLSHLGYKKMFRAENGHPGEGKNRDGKDGQPVYIEVPPGTVIKNAETGELIHDMQSSPDPFVLLVGGIGGRGNTHFKTSRRQAPRFAQDGMPGQSMVVTVEIRLIADIGLVGLPNAGKSSLLKAITAANPKIGSYAFTTLVPNLGVVRREDCDVVLADIPGLIEGAHTGAGLGTVFLKHVARTGVIAYVIDLERDDPVEQYSVLRKELGAYSSDILEKREFVIAHKCDLDPDAGKTRTLADALSPVRVIPVSAAARLGLETVIGIVTDLVCTGGSHDSEPDRARNSEDAES